MSKVIKDDVISKSALLKAFEDNDLFLPEVIKKLINNQPSALEGFVSELKEEENRWTDEYKMSSGYDDYARGMSEAFEQIVDMIV